MPSFLLCTLWVTTFRAILYCKLQWIKYTPSYSYWIYYFWVFSLCIFFSFLPFQCLIFYRFVSLSLATQCVDLKTTLISIVSMLSMSISSETKQNGIATSDFPNSAAVHLCSTHFVYCDAAFAREYTRCSVKCADVFLPFPLSLAVYLSFLLIRAAFRCVCVYPSACKVVQLKCKLTAVASKLHMYSAVLMLIWFLIECFYRPDVVPHSKHFWFLIQHILGTVNLSNAQVRWSHTHMLNQHISQFSLYIWTKKRQQTERMDRS